MSAFICGAVALLAGIVSLFLGRSLPSVAKKGRITQPEAGGLASVAGVVAGLLVGVGFGSYSAVDIEQLPLLIAVMTLILVVVLDLVGRHYLSLRSQTVPALFLLAGLVPAIAKAGGVGTGSVAASGAAIAAGFILVPIGISASAYLVNQFKGYGDLGMATVAIGALCGVALLKGEFEALLILLAGLGAMLPLLVYIGRQPAKMGIGDVGTFSIGALIAIAVVLGGFELAGVIVLIPYLVNLGLKARGRSLGQLIMNRFGLNERTLALTLIGFEAVFGTLAVIVYVVR